MSLFYYVRFFLFFLGCLIHCHVQFVACTFVTCCNKDQSINQSINQSIKATLFGLNSWILWPKSDLTRHLSFEKPTSSTCSLQTEQFVLSCNNFAIYFISIYRSYRCSGRCWIFCLNCFGLNSYSWIFDLYHVRKRCYIILPLILPNGDRFSKFFHWQA